jgi:hypothetical protein
MYGFDFSLTREGDLELGIEKVNDRGDILYRHPDGTIDTTQPIGSVSIRDIGLIRSKQSVQQLIYNRLKTDNPEWYHHQQIGANLSDLIGEPNTRETADKGVEYISASLRYKGFLEPGQFSTRAIPVGPNEIMFLLTVVLENEEEFRLPLVFDLHRGLKEVAFE